MKINWGKLLAALAIAVGVMFVANLLVDNSYSHRLVRAAINEKLNALTKINVEFQALEVRVFPLEAVLYGVKVTPKAAPHASLLESSQLKARVSFTSLIMGQPALSLLEANELKFAFPLPEEFDGILIEPSDPNEPIVWPPDFPLPIERIVTLNSSLDVHVPAAKPGDPDEIHLQANGLNLDFEFDNWQSMEANLEINSLNFFVWNRHLVKDASLNTEIELYRNEILTNHLELASQTLNFSGKMKVLLDILKEKSKDIKARKLVRNLLHGVKLDLTADVKNSDLSVLGSFLDIGETGGLVEGQTTVKVDIPIQNPGHEVTWSVNGKGKSHNAQLYGFLLYDSDTTFEVDANEIRFPEITVRKDDHVFGKGRGKVGFDANVPFDFTAAPEGLPLTTLLTALKVPNFTVLDGSIVSPALRVHGAGTPFRLDVAGIANLENVSVPIITYDQSKFPTQPACQLEVKLWADDSKLDFANSHGFCTLSKDGLPPIKDALELPAGASALKLAGYTSFNAKKGMDLQIDAPNLQAKFGEHFAQIALEGDAQVRTRVHGPYNDIKVTNTFTGKNLGAAGIPLGEASGEVTVLAGKPKVEVHFNHVQMAPEKDAVATIEKGFLRLDDEYSFEADISGKNLSGAVMNQIGKAADPNIDLQFLLRSLKASIKGPLLYPFAYQGEITADAQEFRFNGQQYFSRLQAHLLGQKGGWELREANYELGRLKALVKGTHKRKRPFSIAAAKATTEFPENLGLSLNDSVQFSVDTITPDDPVLRSMVVDDQRDHLRNLPFAGALLKDIGLGGEIVFSGKFDGTFKKVQGQFNGALDNPVLFGSALAPVRFKGFVDGSQLEIPEISQGGNALVGRMSMDFLAPGIPYEWYFSFNSFDLRAFTPDAFYTDPRNFAYLNANWRMKGKFQDFWKSKGELNIQNIEIVYVKDSGTTTEKVVMRHEFPVTLKMDDSGWVLQDRRELFLKGNYGALFISTPGNAPPEKLNIRFHGSIDMAVFKQLFSVIEIARGKLLFNGSITGSVKDPEFSFQIEDKKVDPFNAAGWEPVSVGLMDVPPAFTNIRANIIFRNNRLEINRLTADKGKSGRLSVTGYYLPFSDDKDASNILISLQDIELNRLPVPVFKSADFVLDGDLVLSGNQLPLRLAGNIDVKRGQSLSNFDIRNQILDMIRRRRINAPSAPKKPLLNLDIQVGSDNTITVKNRNLVAKAAADLRIMGTDQAPLILGQIQVPKGKFNYKRDFNITRGLIQFDEPVNPPDPRLDIIGESQVNRYRVQVMISGYASDPKVSLAVEPPNRPDGTPITKVDILLLLSSGHLPDSERNIGAEGSAARAEALNLVIGQFEEPIERLFDLSGQTVIRQVYLDTYTAEQDGDPVARLNLPINISEDVNLIFQVDNDANMKISSEYSIHDSISVSGSFDKKKEHEGQKTKNLPADTDTGVDLKFRFSFP